MTARDKKSTPAQLAAASTAASLALLSYMVFEAQWVRCRQTELPVPGLPRAWSGTTILHLSDVHASPFLTNKIALRKAVRWAQSVRPDLVLLTGDILGDPRFANSYLDLLACVDAPLGKFAVTGNHEFGLSKGLVAHTHAINTCWEHAGITLLRDRWVSLPERAGSRLLVYGADYLTGPEEYPDTAATPQVDGDNTLRILLTHEPPSADSQLQEHFDLAFAGHTHGGQLRVPTREGLVPLNGKQRTYVGGVYQWGKGLLVVSKGLGTSFLPFRLLTRPEAVLWRLV